SSDRRPTAIDEKRRHPPAFFLGLLPIEGGLPIASFVRILLREDSPHCIFRAHLSVRAERRRAAPKSKQRTLRLRGLRPLRSGRTDNFMASPKRPAAATPRANGQLMAPPKRPAAATPRANGQLMASPKRPAAATPKANGQVSCT